MKKIAQKQGDRKRQIYIKDLPFNLHAEAKSEAAKCGVTLRDFVIAAIQQSLTKTKSIVGQ